METKTIKIPKAVHRELKVYVVNKDGYNMEEIAGYAIMEYLQSVGHKFSVKHKPLLNKTKK